MAGASRRWSRDSPQGCGWENIEQASSPVGITNLQLLGTWSKVSDSEKGCRLPARRDTGAKGGVMTQHDLERLLLRLRSRDDVSPEEEQALRWAVSEVKYVPKKKTLIREGTTLSVSTLLLEGLVVRYKDLSDSARQITQLHVPGDFVDLHSFTLKRLDHSVMSITDCRIASFPHDRLRAITERYPHLTRLLWFFTNVDAAAHREWELSLGRRSALQKTAHLFCELYYRLNVVGLTEGSSFAFPFTQTEIAEAKGLTSVHVNRTLKELREGQFITVRRGQVTIHDLGGLMRICEFDPAYLYLEQHPV